MAVQCEPHCTEFIPETVWHGHPMKFSVPSPIVEPSVDRILEPKMQNEDANSTSAPMLLMDIDTVEEAKNGKKSSIAVENSGLRWL
ncbi:hypothetical protein COLO4_05652 [Corchorus olitorius]|uniref:Uncharacterized protein n=1 Tax=Corchorus olitorius TaxID=93759 RepID=A0A1R3KQE0_9ROSI|nr:hypothetical protein COLO4_05652 [Corchorus olitorius]